MIQDRAHRFVQDLDAEETRRAYRYDLECFFDFLTDRDRPVDVVEVSPTDIRHYFDHLDEQALSVSTKRRRVAAVRRFFDWLRKEGVVPFTPVQDAPSFTAEHSGNPEDERFLDRETLSALLDDIDRDDLQGHRDYTLILLIVYGALRRAEVASLDVENVRPLGRHWVIDLPTSYQTQGGYVRIPDAVAEQVQRLADRYDEADGPLWRSLGNRNRGGRLSPDALYKIVRRVGRTAGVERLSIEVLRRSGLRLASVGGATLSQLRDHARLKTAASAAQYTAEDNSGRLSSSVSDRIPLNVEQ